MEILRFHGLLQLPILGGHPSAFWPCVLGAAPSHSHCAIVPGLLEVSSVPSGM